MLGKSADAWYGVLKVLSHVTEVAMAGAILYAAAMAVYYWPGIGV